MKKLKLKLKTIKEFENYLYEEERSAATIDKYIRDIKALYAFLAADKIVSKPILIQYKKSLNGKYKITNINSIITVINSAFISALLIVIGSMKIVYKNTSFS